MKLAQAAETPAQRVSFKKKYRADMAAPDARHALELLIEKGADLAPSER